MLASLAVALAFAAPPACSADVPAAMALTGVPPTAVSGQSYTMRLVETGDGAVAPGSGSTLALHDRRGVGWSATRDFALGVSQQFSVGLTGAPYTATGTYSEISGSGTCSRTLSTSMGVERRVLAVVNCRRGVVEPRSGLVLRCDGHRLRLTRLSWNGWDSADAVTGRGRLHGRTVKIRLSHPVECSPLDGFIYSRARIGGGRRIAIDCPIL